MRLWPPQEHFMKISNYEICFILEKKNKQIISLEEKKKTLEIYNRDLVIYDNHISII